MGPLISATCARLLLMERQLREGGIPVACASTASVPTFKRDLQRLRAELGAVVVFNRNSMVYELRNQDWSGVMPHLLEEVQQATIS